MAFRRTVVVVAAVTALAFAPSASAHAFLVSSSPAADAELTHAPTAVALTFDEGVRPAAGIKVVRNGGGSVTAAKAYVPAGKGNEIVIPLRRGLGRGVYSVLWREIDVDDGHLISGSFAFAVGTGLGPTTTIFSAGGNGAPFAAIASRWILLLGILLAAGFTLFGLLVRRGARAQRRWLAGTLAMAALGALLSVVLEPGTSATRFGHWTEIGGAVAAAGALSASVSRRMPQVVALALLGLPTATGHATVPGPSHWLSIPADLVHLAAAAFWLGGSVELALLAPRSELHALARRYSPLALATVGMLGASGVLRAIGELTAVHQLWSTGYGQAILVKTGVAAALVALGWLNRYRLLPKGGDFRASIGGEVVLLLVALGAVAMLTNARPGRDYRHAAPATDETVVLAGEDDDLAVGIAITPQGDGLSLRASVLGFAGPTNGLGLRFIVGENGSARFAAASPCGAGCYRAQAPVSRPTELLLRIARRGRPPATLTFTLPATWPAADATAIVRRATDAIHSLRTLVVHSHLASDARHAVDTTYRMAAPDRLEYVNGDGSAAVVIGNRRWDRTSAAAPWVERSQDPPIESPAPFWPARFTDAHILRTTTVDGWRVWVVSFLDPVTPAWFTAWIDQSSYETIELRMVTTAHFMHDVNGPFDAPLRIAPPR